MKAVGIVAGLATVSLLAIGAKRHGPQALAKACHGLMAGKLQEHCGGEATACCTTPVQGATTDPGEAGQTAACEKACAEG